MRRRFKGNHERGAVAVIVAVLFSSMVLIACAALTIDVGRISAERRELQNGADAVALSVAKDCAKSSSCLPAGNISDALANDNAADGFTKIGRVDGDLRSICGVGPDLPACPALENHLRDCVEPAGGMPATWVRAYTTTQNSSDPSDTILPHVFGQALAGGDDGHQSQACAQAGLVGGYDPKKVVPIAQSLCAWEDATKNGFPPPPSYTPSPDVDAKPKLPDVPSMIDRDKIAKIIVMTDATDGPATCGKSGSTYTPGNFGWLDQVGDSSTTCEAVSVGPTMGGTGGVAPSQGCLDTLGNKVGTIVYIPITKTSSGTGENTEYVIEGLAAFYLAGVDFNGASVKKTYNGYEPNVPDPTTRVMLGCDGKDTTANGCLWGWYLNPLLPSGSSAPGGGIFGPTTISLLG